MKKITVYISVLIATAGYSQTIPTDTTVKKSITLSEVVISVNKVEEQKNKVAQEVKVIDAKEIANSQSQTTADLLQNVAGLQVQKSQMEGGSPTIRGFEANRIVLVVDGVRMNNLIYRAGHLQNIVTIDNGSLDRVEVLFGPSSTIYGSDALGGVVHMYTKKPLFAGDDGKMNLKVNAFTRYGDVNNEVTGHLDFNVGGKKLASMTSFTYSIFGDLKGGENQNPFYSGSYGERPYYVERFNGKDSLVRNTGRYSQKQSAYNQYSLMEKLAFKQNEHITHGLNIQYANTTNVPRYDRLTDPKGGGLKYAEWYYGPEMRMLGAYDFNLTNKEKFFSSIHAGLNFQNIEESRHTRKFNDDNLTHRTEKVNVIGANLDFQHATEKHSVRFGVDFQYNTLKSTANVVDITTGISDSLDTRYPDGKNNMMNSAVYFSHTWQINKQLSLVDGIRVGYSTLHSSFVDTALLFHIPFTTADQKNPVYSGSLGFIHTPTDDVKLSLLFSTGYRVPNLDDLSKVFESAPGAVIVPNPDLKPEKTYNWDLGISKVFNQKTSWENAVYYTSIVDAITTDEYTLNGKDSIMYENAMTKVYANQNKRQAYIYGFSSSLKSQLSEHLLLNVGMSYTYGRVKTDSADYPLDHIPPFITRVAFTYTNNKFTGDFSINYNGWKRMKDYYIAGEDNEQYATADGMPAWFTANLHLSYKVHKLITLQAGVDNIMDTQYRTFASGINAPGRNVFVALRFHY